MAGDWIPVRHDLFEDPAVISMAQRLEIDEDAVVGKLIRVWSWFDRQSIDGIANATARWIDRLANCPGFAEAMCDVGWLISSDNKVEVPRFDSWISQSAKSRIQAAKRQQEKRVRDSVTPTSRSQRDRNVTTEKDRKGRKAVSVSDTGAGTCALGATSGDRTDTESVFRNVKPEHLDDTAVLREWFYWQSTNPEGTRGAVLQATDENFELVLGIAEYVMAGKKIKQPHRLFAQLVGRKDWERITPDQMERARSRIKKLGKKAN